MRRLVAAVVLTAAAAGCGDGDAGLAVDAEATTTTDASSSTTALSDRRVPTGAGTALEVDLLGESRVPAGPYTWAIALTNASDEAVVVTFPNSQKGDVVLTRDGEAVHRWSDGRFFQQQVTEVSIAAGAVETIELTDDLTAVEPGFYDITVSVSVVGPPEPVTESIRVVSPGG
ncbi:BsuPI-related putative proteinase inhibitor [Actinospongicola halichondriae]|uniref:BsuPI-related putative proteinase inhibitor n=1 Tax=Actinospongicola halichondriae TaxID=3236844 RepID=UPI003D3922B0